MLNFFAFIEDAVTTLRQARHRERELRLLARLDDGRLHDIGISRDDVSRMLRQTNATGATLLVLLSMLVPAKSRRVQTAVSMALLSGVFVFVAGCAAHA